MNRKLFLKESLLRMAQGDFERLVDVEVDRVIQNIMDPSTKAETKRKITVTIGLTPSSDRQTIQVDVAAKTTLVPASPAKTVMAVTSDENGEMMIVEMTPQIPGQMDFSGGQQRQPKLMRIVQGEE